MAPNPAHFPDTLPHLPPFRQADVMGWNFRGIRLQAHEAFGVVLSDLQLCQVMGFLLSEFPEGGVLKEYELEGILREEFFEFINLVASS